MAKKLPELNTNPLDDIFATEQERQEEKLEKIINIPISEIHEFKNHPFEVRNDEDMNKLVESIHENRVLQLTLVRPSPYGNGKWT